MKPILRVLIILVLLVGILPVSAATVKAQELNTCQSVTESIFAGTPYSASFQEGVIDGAKYCLILPPIGYWNQDMVLVSHGYVFADPYTMSTDNPEIPWDQAIRGDLNLPKTLVQLGYGFGISSYRKTGLAVKEGVQDMVNLTNLVKASLPVTHVFLAGVSEGGLVTTLALEQNPDLFTAGLETCGPVGSFQNQVSYWGDFRAVFDALFPDVLKDPNPPLYSPSDAIYNPLDVIIGWATGERPIAGRVQQAVSADPIKTALLLQATHAPIDPGDPTSLLTTIGGILDYNIQATDEARIELRDYDIKNKNLAKATVGNPYSNADHAFDLPQGVHVANYAADPKALQEIATNYETSGNLVKPLVMMHNTGDPIVPFWHTQLYTGKVVQAGSADKLGLYPIQSYGHCNFTQADVLNAFSLMLVMSGLQPPTLPAP